MHWGGPITLVPLRNDTGNNHKKEKFSRTTDWSCIVAWGGNSPAKNGAPSAARTRARPLKSRFPPVIWEAPPQLHLWRLRHNAAKGEVEDVARARANN